MKNLNEVNTYIELGCRIKYLRKLRKMSIETLAFECEINKNYLCDSENGRRNPTLLVLCKIAKGLNISLEELFKGIGNSVN